MVVKTAFFNGVAEEEVYVEQPLGFETHDKYTRVCKLKNSSLEEISTRNGPFNPNSNSMSSCVS